jgi:hypothetical protein
MPASRHSFAEPQRRERRQLGGLEDDGVAAGERRSQLPARDVCREVPGDDEADDAERLPEGGRHAPSHGDRLPTVLVDRTGVEVEHLRHHPDLSARARDRLAHVLGLDARQLVGVLLDERREPSQEPCPIGRRHRAPGREGRLGIRDRLVRLLDPRLLELGDRHFRRRVDDGQGHAKPRLCRMRQIP